MRSTESEYIDDPGIAPSDYAEAMRDLEKVNRILCAYRSTLDFLETASQGMNSIRIIDVGSGHGDTLRRIARWAARRGIAAELTGLDLSPAATAAAIAATPPELQIRFITGDVFAHVPDPAPEFIVSSLFAHHLSDHDVIRFVRWMDTHAHRGWHINDLHRHPMAWAGFRVMSRVMGWHPIVQNDGAVSVRRGFTRGEWGRILEAAGVDKSSRIEWWFPFRFGISRVG
jgi:SAM-dependent methyltransferase